MPVSPVTVSSAPPLASAIAGRPHESGPAVMLPDPVADVERVSDEQIDAIGAQPIPQSESMRDHGTEEPFERARTPGREVLGGEVPEVPDRRIAVAHVKRVGARDHALRRAMAD